MASTTNLVCKLRCGDETRRVTVQTNSVTYLNIHTFAKDLFELGDSPFKLQYTDDEGDIITMSTDQEMAEAVGLAQIAMPPILRLKVHFNNLKTMPPPTPAAAGMPLPPAAPAAPPPPRVDAATDPAVNPDLSQVLKDIEKGLPSLFEGGQNGPSAPELTALFKNVTDALPGFANGLPDAIKDALPHAQLDVGATAAHAANLAAAFGAGTAPNVTFSVLPPHGYGDVGVHPGVTCDKSGMCPIVGPRYNLKGHNYDLCEAEFAKLEPSEKAKFIKMEPPFGGMPNCNNKNSNDNSNSNSNSNSATGFHPGVTCDKSGMCPIVGPRYNLKGHNYDLCEAEFAKLVPAEQANFTKMEPPCAGDPSRLPWKPMKWWRGGMGGGPCGGMGGGGFGGGGFGGSPCGGFGGGMGGGGMGCGRNGGNGGEHPNPMAKLAARFVSDVSIFDGTQMAPGTKFTKIWRIKNVGEVAWPAGTKLLFVGGDQMAAEMTVPVAADPSKMVMPGEEVDVAVDMVAPSDMGRYMGYWRLTGPMGRRRFGQRIWCHIQVVDPCSQGIESGHDPKAVAAEISHMMARASKDDPDETDEPPESGAAGTSRAVPAAAPDPISEAAATVMPTAVHVPAEVPAEVPPPVPPVPHPLSSPVVAAVSSAVSSVSSSVSSLSSVVSSATSSAVSVHKEGLPKEGLHEDEQAVAKEAVEKALAAVAGAAASAEAAAAKAPTEIEAPVEVEVPAPVEAPVEAADKEPKDANDVATQLLTMGFEPSNVTLMVEKHGGLYPPSAMLEAATRDLVNMSEWDEMLSDLEEMGFDDRELNKKLMVKHNGSVKRTVKDLVAETA